MGEKKAKEKTISGKKKKTYHEGYLFVIKKRGQASMEKDFGYARKGKLHKTRTIVGAKKNSSKGKKKKGNKKINDWGVKR